MFIMREGSQIESSVQWGENIGTYLRSPWRKKPNDRYGSTQGGL